MTDPRYINLREDDWDGYVMESEGMYLIETSWCTLEQLKAVSDRLAQIVEFEEATVK